MNKPSELIARADEWLNGIGHTPYLTTLLIGKMRDYIKLTYHYDSQIDYHNDRWQLMDSAQKIFHSHNLPEKLQMFNQELGQKGMVKASLYNLEIGYQKINEIIDYLTEHKAGE